MHDSRNPKFVNIAYEMSCFLKENPVQFEGDLVVSEMLRVTRGSVQ